MNKLELDMLVRFNNSKCSVMQIYIIVKPIGEQNLSQITTYLNKLTKNTGYFHMKYCVVYKQHTLPSEHI